VAADNDGLSYIYIYTHTIIGFKKAKAYVCHVIIQVAADNDGLSDKNHL
jgi:hypothetical protein